jgi:PAS domain-containing protein
VEATLAEYLSHAPVFVRKRNGEIIYWTLGAEELYGFSAEEAVAVSPTTFSRRRSPRNSR